MTEAPRLNHSAKATPDPCRFPVDHSGNPSGRPLDGPAASAAVSTNGRVAIGILPQVSCIFPVLYRKRPRRMPRIHAIDPAAPGPSLTRSPPQLDIAEPVDDGVEARAHHRRGLVLDDDGRAGYRGAGREVLPVIDRHVAELAVERVEDAAMLGRRRA